MLGIKFGFSYLHSKSFLTKPLPWALFCFKGSPRPKQKKKSPLSNSPFCLSTTGSLSAAWKPQPSGELPRDSRWSPHQFPPWQNLALGFSSLGLALLLRDGVGLEEREKNRGSGKTMCDTLHMDQVINGCPDFLHHHTRGVQAALIPDN